MNYKTLRYLILLTFILSAYNAKAWKVKTDTTVYAGVWGGASYARIMGFYQTSTPLIKPSYGFQLSFQPTREISTKSGIGLITKGTSSEQEYFDIYNNSIGFYATNHSFKYLNIPFTLSYNLGQKKFNVYLSLGFDIDFLLKQESYSDVVPKEFNGTEVLYTRNNNTDLYKFVNFGVHIGGGLEYRIKPNIIAFADVKYMHGLNNIIDANSIYIYKHRPVVIGFGVRFGIPITYNIYE